MLLNIFLFFLLFHILFMTWLWVTESLSEVNPIIVIKTECTFISPISDLLEVCISCKHIVVWNHI